jgi:hypothetical protein
MVCDVHLSPETLLQLAPGIRTRLDPAGHVLVDAPDGTIIDLGPAGFATLSLFAPPLTLGDAIERLERNKGRSTDFLPTMSAINMLIEEGALVSPEAPHDPARGWADPVEHARMLHDHRRTEDYIMALTEAVRPGDVVLDIGTGSGVLLRSPPPGPAPGTSMRSRPAISRRSPGGCSQPTACRTRSP